MLGVTLLQIAAQIVAVYFGARTAMAVGRDVRAAIFDRVQEFSAREVGQFGAPSLITRTTNDVQQVQMLVLLTFTLMVSAPIMCVGGIVLALHQDVPLSGAAAGRSCRSWSPLVGLIITRMRPLFRSMQVRIDRVNRVMREQITGIRVIRAFVRDDREQDRFGGRQRRADRRLAAGRQADGADVPDRDAGRERLQRGRALVRRAPDRRRARMQIGALTAFLSYLMQILMSVMMATFMFVMIPRAEVCAERIEEVLDTDVQRGARRRRR